MTTAYTIVGYTYRADTLCPACTIEAMIADREASPAARDMAPEEALEQIAAANAIDRHDLHSYDSDNFPKVVFADQLRDVDEEHGPETCGSCDQELGR